MMTLYEDLKDAGIPIDNHESDLYCLDTPESRELCKAWEKKFSSFVSQVDGKPWLDVFGAFDPFWTEKSCGSFAREHGIPIAEVVEAVRIADRAAKCAEHVCNGDTYPGGKDATSGKNENAKQWQAEQDECWKQLAEIFGPHGFEITSTGLRPCLKKDGEYYDIPQ